MINIDFSGKNILITGGGGGITGGVATCFAKAGAKVILTDISLDRMDTNVKAVKDLGGEIDTYPLDVTDYDAVVKLVDEVHKKEGKIDFLCPGAGVFKLLPFLDVPYEQYLRTIDINLNGMYAVCHAVAKKMHEQGFGKIVCIASDSTNRGNGGFPDYSIAKQGVRGLVQSLADALGPEHINVNGICPGIVHTDMTYPLFGVLAEWIGSTFEAELEKYTQTVPLRRIQEAEDIGNAAVFLCSPMADNITGQCINVNGGAQMH